VKLYAFIFLNNSIWKGLIIWLLHQQVWRTEPDQAHCYRSDYRTIGAGCIVIRYTHSMVQDIIWKADYYSVCQTIACFLYGTRRFINVFTKACHLTLFWASRIQLVSSIPISLRSILMLSSYQWSLTFGLPNRIPVTTSPPCVPHVLPTSSPLI
jgi:hypothetical protein